MARFGPTSGVVWSGPARGVVTDSLARLQVRIAVEEWHAVAPEFHLREGADLRWSVGLDSSLRALDVEW